MTRQGIVLRFGLNKENLQMPHSPGWGNHVGSKKRLCRLLIKRDVYCKPKSNEILHK